MLRLPFGMPPWLGFWCLVAGAQALGGQGCLTGLCISEVGLEAEALGQSQASGIYCLPKVVLLVSFGACYLLRGKKQSIHAKAAIPEGVVHTLVPIDGELFNVRRQNIACQDLRKCSQHTSAILKVGRATAL